MCLKHISQLDYNVSLQYFCVQSLKLSSQNIDFQSYFL